MFKSPKINTTPPPVPVVEDTDAAKQEYQDALRKRKGRAASILDRTNAAAPTAAKVLLGA